MLRDISCKMAALTEKINDRWDQMVDILPP